jgi:hypothetical protein
MAEQQVKMAEQVGQGKGSSATVTVACKLPAGLILRGFRKMVKQEVVMGGGVRDVPEFVPTGEQFVIKGYSVPQGDLPAPPVALAGSFALTHNVPRKLWDEWLEANEDSDLVKRGLIFASGDERSARDQIKDHAKEKNGLEPLDPKNLPRLSRRFKVETYSKDKEEAA